MYDGDFVAVCRHLAPIIAESHFLRGGIVGSALDLYRNFLSALGFPGFALLIRQGDAINLELRAGTHQRVWGHRLAFGREHDELHRRHRTRRRATGRAQHQHEGGKDAKISDDEGIFISINHILIFTLQIMNARTLFYNVLRRQLRGRCHKMPIKTLASIEPRSGTNSPSPASASSVRYFSESGFCRTCTADMR